MALGRLERSVVGTPTADAAASTLEHLSAKVEAGASATATDTLATAADAMTTAADAMTQRSIVS